MSDSKNLDAKKHGVLYIGMDLGTSRTSVSASNGVRETVFSVVGYPKDVVSQKLLKKDVLYGKEALDKRLSLRMYKPLEKGVLKYTGEAKDPEAKANGWRARAPTSWCTA
jgi:rod shape-determining protein MreB